MHDSRGIERRQRLALAFGREPAVRNQGVGMGTPVSPIGAENLQRNDDAAWGADVGAVKDGLERLQDRGIGRLQKHVKQFAVALEGGMEKVQWLWGTGATIPAVSSFGKGDG